MGPGSCYAPRRDFLPTRRPYHLGVQSPLRDEHETLERRLEALKAENARLRAEVAALPAKSRAVGPWLLFLLCLLAAAPTACAGYWIDLELSASKNP